MKERTVGVDWGFTGQPGYYSVAAYSRLVIQDAFEHLTPDYAFECDAEGQLLISSTMSGSLLGTEKIWCTHNKPPRFNDCDHWFVGGINYPVSGVLRKPNWGEICYVYKHYRFLPSYLSSMSAVLSHPNIDLRGARSRAWLNFQPEFEGNISMLNFIFELKDFKDIFKFVLNKPLKKLCNSFRRWRFETKKYKKFDLSKPIAAAHLTNEYAIKPFVSDIVTIHQELKEIVMAAQDQFQLEGLSDNVRHYSETFEHEKSLIPYVVLYSGYLYQTRFTATLSYRYNYEARSFLDAFTRYWGLGLTAEAVWNAIPFSFLADYFCNIGQTLSLIRTDPNVTLLPDQYCESLLTQKHEGYVYDADENEYSAYGTTYRGHCVLNGAYAPSGKHPVAGVNSRLYTRKVCYPYYGAVLPSFRMPSMKQWLNMAALTRCIL